MFRTNFLENTIGFMAIELVNLSSILEVMFLL